MGNEQPKKQFDPKKDKLTFEISCIKVKSHIELQKDRKQNELNFKEKNLIKIMQAPTRNKQDEVHKASSIVTDVNFVKACDIVIRYCDVLKDRSLFICECRGQNDKIVDLLPYIESVIWSAKPLNLNCLQEFQSLMLLYFGNEIYESVQKSSRVDPELKACFEHIIPTPKQVNDYIVEFSNRSGLSLDKINECGHEFQSNFPESNNNNFQPGGNQPFGNGGFGGGGQQIPQNYAQVQQPQDYNVNIQIQPQYNPYQQQQCQYNIASSSQQYGVQFQPQQYQIPQQNFQFGYQNQQQNQFQQQPQQQPYFMQPPQDMIANPSIKPQDNFIQQQQYPGLNGIQVPNNINIGGQGNFDQNQMVKPQQQQNVSPNQQQNKNQNQGQQQQGGGNNALPSLDDFEERMRKLRENL